MWRNYLVVAARALARHRTYAFINILGLSLGMASCLLILLFVRHELSFDKWLPNADRIYGVQATMVGVGEDKMLSARAPRMTAETLKREFPQIEQAVAMTRERSIVSTGAEPAFVTLTFASPNFFTVFDLPFVRGDSVTALAKPGDLVLTQSQARRFFGKRDPLGKTLTLSYRGSPKELKVTGILRDLPGNSHLELDLITPYADALYGIHEGEANSWSQLTGFVYVKLREARQAGLIQAAMPAVVKRNIPDDAEAHPTELRLVPVPDIHLEHSHEGSMKPGGDKLAITAFSMIALFILAIACVNFTNLATAQASQRAREVALRKVLGARRGQLIAQFLGEAMLITGLATVVGLALVELILPSFSALVGSDLRLDYFGPNGLIVPILFLAGVTGLICGVYPAFILSASFPGHVLRQHQATIAGGSGRLRNLLVLTQFAISIGLIVCTAVVYAQTRHARASDPGYRQDGLLVVRNAHRASPETRIAFSDQVRRLAGVRAATRSDVAPADDQETIGQFQLPGNPQPYFLNYNSVDWHFRDTLQLPLLAGRFFQEGRSGDDSSVGYNPYGEDAEALLARGSNVVISAGAASKLGFSSPGAAIGKQILSPFLSRPELVPTTIVGVVGDAQYRSVRDTARPTVYHVNSTPFTYVIARYDTARPDRLREQVGALWSRYFPNVPFEADFAEDRVAELYQGDEVRGRVFAVATGLAIAVACLGLFGLAAFTAQRRTREIGIRKVFGARTRDIVRLLLWQFCQPVLFANLIAWPVAWWLMRDWLNGFSERVDLDPAWFAGAGLLALAVAAATIVSHALQVARLNPIHALRYE